MRQSLLYFANAMVATLQFQMVYRQVLLIILTTIRRFRPTAARVVVTVPILAVYR